MMLLAIINKYIYLIVVDHRFIILLLCRYVMAVLVAENISKSFGKFKAVDKISFKINKGEILAFLGPNGAGKTTTMRMVTGYLTPDQGNVLICDYNLYNDPIKAKNFIGYLPETGALYTDMLVIDFLKFITEVRIKDKNIRKSRIDYVISKLELNLVLNKVIEDLSKGFKRRVALASALIHDPLLLVLDEPTDGLDPNQKFEVQELIKNIAKDKAIIISTHILDEVENICKQAIIINNGKLILEGNIKELIVNNKANNLTELFRLVTNNQQEIKKY